MPLALFDLDNTLIDRADAFRRWTEELITGLGLDPAEADWLAEVDGDGFTSRTALFTAIRERYGLTEPAGKLLERYRERVVELIEPDPRVPLALARLRAAGWRVGIVTNGATAQQLAKVERAGLADPVDAVVVSAEVGVEKPDPRIFQLAAHRCGTSLAGGGWMVGDCPTRDVGGGAAVGLRTGWIRRGRAWPAGPPCPDRTVDHVLEVFAAITTNEGLTWGNEDLSG